MLPNKAAITLRRLTPAENSPYRSFMLSFQTLPRRRLRVPIPIAEPPDLPKPRGTWEERTTLSSGWP